MSRYPTCPDCGTYLDADGSCWVCPAPVSTVPTVDAPVVSDGGNSGTRSDPVPSHNGPEQAKGHSGRSGHTSEEDADAELLAGIRNGAWLDAQTFPPLAYAIPGLIPEGFTLAVGAPKVGKSNLLLGVQLAVAAGGYALGQIPVGPARRVLYLALEDGDRRMQDRARGLMEGKPLPALFEYVTAVQPGRVLDTVDAFLRQHPDTALVTLDTLGKVMPPALQGESAYQRDYRIGGQLKRLADRYPGLAVVVVHHDRKAGGEDFVDSVSGTHGLAGSADTIAVLCRKRKSAEGLLKITGRDVPENEYALRGLDGRTWILDGSTLDEAADRATQREEIEHLSDLSTQILDFVRGHPSGVSTANVVARFGENARRYLARLTDSGRLVRQARGQYSVPSVPTSQPQVSAPALWDSVPNGRRTP